MAGCVLVVGPRDRVWMTGEPHKSRALRVGLSRERRGVHPQGCELQYEAG